MFFAGNRLGDLNGNVFSQISKAYKKAVPKNARTIVGAALITGAVGGTAYAAGITPASIVSFFKSSGMTDAAAKAAADSVIQGQMAPPPGLTEFAQARQASMFGDWGTYMIPIAIVGVGALAFMLMPKKKGGRHVR